MFMCEKCHKTEIKQGCPNFHPFTSFGHCEVCEKPGQVTVDCKFYRSYVEPQKKVRRRNSHAKR